MPQKKGKEQDKITITVVYDRISGGVGLTVTMLHNEQITVADVTEALVEALRIAPQLGRGGREDAQERGQPKQDKEVDA